MPDGRTGGDAAKYRLGRSESLAAIEWHTNRLFSGLDAVLLDIRASYHVPKILTSPSLRGDCHSVLKFFNFSTEGPLSLSTKIKEF